MTIREQKSMIAITKAMEAIHELKYQMGDAFHDPKMQESLGLLHAAQKLYKEEVTENVHATAVLSRINHRF